MHSCSHGSWFALFTLKVSHICSTFGPVDWNLLYRATAGDDVSAEIESSSSSFTAKSAFVLSDGMSFVNPPCTIFSYKRCRSNFKLAILFLHTSTLAKSSLFSYPNKQTCHAILLWYLFQLCNLFWKAKCVIYHRIYKVYTSHIRANKSNQPHGPIDNTWYDFTHEPRTKGFCLPDAKCDQHWSLQYSLSARVLRNSRLFLHSKMLPIQFNRK